MPLASFTGKGQYSASGPTELHRVFVDRLYRPLGTARPVVWCHAFGDDATAPCPNGIETYAPLLRAVTDLGLPIISFDAGSLSHWGNDTAVSRLTDALAYLRTAYGASASLTPILVGTSMGGALVLNWARANPTLVRGMVLMFPAVNLQGQHDGTGGASAGWAASLEAAYGGSLGTFNTAMPTHDPAQNAAAHAVFRTQYWYGDSDTVVGSANQAAFATAVNSGMWDTRPLVGATHADMTKINASAFASFVAGLAGQ